MKVRRRHYTFGLGGIYADLVILYMVLVFTFVFGSVHLIHFWPNLVFMFIRGVTDVEIYRVEKLFWTGFKFGIFGRIGKLHLPQMIMIVFDVSLSLWALFLSLTLCLLMWLSQFASFPHLCC